MGVSRRAFLKGAAYGLASSVVAGAYADYGVHKPQLEKSELRLKNWRADGLRVGFITDIHVNDEDEMERARLASEIIAAESPDILLFGGDCINFGRDVSMPHISESLKPLAHLKCPKLAILGNHDYWSNRVEEIEKRLTEAGFLVLKNQVSTFDGYAVAGYDDRIGGIRDDAFQPHHSSLISLMHEPDDVEFVPESAGVQLSGHSHGGQICLPFGIPVGTPKLSRKYCRGFYPDAKVPIYVSRGVGTTGLKWRLFCPPEVTLLTLRSAG